MSDLSLEFQPTTLTVLLSAVAMASICWLGWLAWSRSGYRTSVLFLELLRLAIVALVLLTLNQPETVRTLTPVEKPTMVVLVDRSKSMETQDVVLDAGASIPPIKRSLAAAPLTEETTWSSFRDRWEVVISPFGGTRDESAGIPASDMDFSSSRQEAGDSLPSASGDSEASRLGNTASNEGSPLADAQPTGPQGTDIHRAIAEAQQGHPSLRALVLASDGDWNIGAPPVEAAMRLRASQIPIFSVPFGSLSALPDLELVSFDVPTFGVAGKSVRIPFTIASSLPRDHLAQLELRVSDGSVIRHSLEVKAMGRSSDALVWKPEGIGDYTLELRLPEHPEELVKDNNSRQAPIAIREERLKVLVIESYPRWEYRFLRNALSRDPGVELHCLLFHPDLGKTGGGSKDYIPAFPDSLEELSQYDVVFLGDVGMREGQLTPEQCELLLGMVQQQASGLVFMPGVKGNHLSLVDSPLDPLLPVVFDASQPRGWGARNPGHLILTEQGRSSLLTKLADTADDNMQLWEGLPGFQWHAAIVRSKAGTDVLAVHQDSSNQYGRIPLLVTKTFGAGKVLLMGTDGAWRWRRGVEDLYHYRFWGQVVRWMAYQRNMAKGELMRLYFSPEQPQAGQTVNFNANVADTGGEPLSEAEVFVRVASPSGRTQQIQLSSDGNQWGAFSGDFVPEEPGVHNIQLQCRENDSDLSATLFVQGNQREQLGKPMRRDVLEELSRVTRGQVIDADQLGLLGQAIGAMSDPPQIVQRVSLWSHPGLAALLITCLAAFWIGRKAMGAF